MNDIGIAVLLGIVEGLTEFLPISSTGHLILFNTFLGFKGEFANVFEILIQLGAILAVVFYFRKKLFPFGSTQTPEAKREIWSLWKKTLLAVVPILLVGAVFAERIQELLFNAFTVALALIIGGVIFVCIERKSRTPFITSISSLS